MQESSWLLYQADWLRDSHFTSCGKPSKFEIPKSPAKLLRYCFCWLIHNYWWTFAIQLHCHPLFTNISVHTMAGLKQLRSLWCACLLRKSIWIPPTEWLSISQEGLKWLLRARLWEVHSVFPQNGRQSTAKKVWGSPAFKKSIWFPPQTAGNQPRRFIVAAACPPSSSPYVLPPQMASNQPLKRFVACPPL